MARDAAGSSPLDETSILAGFPDCMTTRLGQADAVHGVSDFRPASDEAAVVVGRLF